MQKANFGYSNVFCSPHIMPYNLEQLLGGIKNPLGVNSKLAKFSQIGQIRKPQTPITLQKSTTGEVSIVLNYSSRQQYLLNEKNTLPKMLVKSSKFVRIKNTPSTNIPLLSSKVETTRLMI